jgi:hypothetical protein
MSTQHASDLMGLQLFLEKHVVHHQHTVFGLFASLETSWCRAVVVDDGFSMQTQKQLDCLSGVLEPAACVSSWATSSGASYLCLSGQECCVIVITYNTVSTHHKLLHFTEATQEHPRCLLAAWCKSVAEVPLDAHLCCSIAAVIIAHLLLLSCRLLWSTLRASSQRGLCDSLCRWLSPTVWCVCRRGQTILAVQGCACGRTLSGCRSNQCCCRLNLTSRVVVLCCKGCSGW